MALRLTTTRTELDRRVTDSIEVTLLWIAGEDVDETIVVVRDSRDGTTFEIVTEPYLALDVFHHPYAYADFGRLVDRGDRVAA